MKVRYIDHMGTDLSVVNAARVSFGKESDWIYHLNDAGVELSDRQLCRADKGLIRFLARGCTTGDWQLAADRFMKNDWKDGEEWEDLMELMNYIRRMPPHWTPFGHTAITLHIKAPIFVTRQINKHQVGFVVNEVSRRYVTDKPEFYLPNGLREAAANVKQGSSDKLVENSQMYIWDMMDANADALSYYEKLIKKGVCPEQARMILPQSMYTEFYMTGNLYGWANLFYQRSDGHAQKEVRDLAAMIGDIIQPLYPESWKVLTE